MATPSESMQLEINRRIQILQAAFDKSAAYANIIIIAGYAGVFAIWSFTKDFLPEITALWVALLVGFSMFVFCGWEVFKMIHSGRAFRPFIELMKRGLPPEDFFREVQILDQKTAAEELVLYYRWYIVLLLTIPTGFGGALLLFYSFIERLIQLTFS